MSDPRFALIGLPTDANSSFRRGAAAGPPAIRTALASDHGNGAAENGCELGHDILIDDHGDLALGDVDTERDDQLIMAGIAAALAAERIPISLGGDHSVTYPIMRAIAERHGPVTILQFDAHPDTYDDFAGNPRSHASPFARIMEAGLARDLIQVGIRTATRHAREQAARFGITMIEMARFSVEAVPVISTPVYISFDLDGLDPACAPGVAHPEPGGLTVREALGVLDRVTGPIIGADIVELTPLCDYGGITAIVAAKLVKEIAARAVANARRAPWH